VNVIARTLIVPDDWGDDVGLIKSVAMAGRHSRAGVAVAKAPLVEDDPTSSCSGGADVTDVRTFVLSCTWVSPGQGDGGQSQRASFVPANLVVERSYG